MPVLGVDVGSTRLHVDIAHGGQAVPVLALDGLPYVPSVIGYANDRVWVGAPVRAHFFVSPGEVLFSPARHLGGAPVKLDSDEHEPESLVACLLGQAGLAAEATTRGPIDGVALSCAAWASPEPRGGLGGLAQAICFLTALFTTGSVATGGGFSIVADAGLLVLVAVAVVFGFHRLSTRSKVLGAAVLSLTACGRDVMLGSQKQVLGGDDGRDVRESVVPDGTAADRMPAPAGLGEGPRDPGEAEAANVGTEEVGPDLPPPADAGHEDGTGEAGATGQGRVGSNFVVDGIAYHRWHEHIVNLADGSTSAVSSLGMNGEGKWNLVAMDGRRYLLTLEMMEEVRLFDVTDPQSIVQRGSIPFARWRFASDLFVAARGAFIYLTGHAEGSSDATVLTFALSNLPPNLSGLSTRPPSMVTTIPSAPSMLDSLVDGEALVLGYRMSANPAPPASLAALDLRTGDIVYFLGAASSVTSVHVDQANRLVYAATEDNELQIWDLTGDVPTRLSSTDLGQFTADFAVHFQDGRTYVVSIGAADRWATLDATDPRNPGPVSRWSFTVPQGCFVSVDQVGSFGRALVFSGRVTLPSGNYSVQLLVDVSHPGSPQLSQVLYLDSLPAREDGTITMSQASGLPSDGGTAAGAFFGPWGFLLGRRCPRSGHVGRTSSQRGQRPMAR